MKKIKQIHDWIKKLGTKFVNFVKKLMYILLKNRRIHTLLCYLMDAERKGDRETKHGHEVTALGRARSSMEIHLDTKIRVDIINDLCFKLVNMGYLKLNESPASDKVYRFNITSGGRLAIIDGIFLNRIWWRNWDIWKWLFPTLISLSTGIIAILAYMN